MQEGNQASKESVQRAEHTDLSLLVDLRERLLKAEGPDRELDLLVGALWPEEPAEIGKAAGRPFNLSLVAMRNGKPICPKFTASVDAALALVERKRPSHKTAAGQYRTPWLSVLNEARSRLGAWVAFKRRQPTQSDLARFICIVLVEDAMIETGADPLHGDDTGTGRGGRHQSRRN